MTPVKQAITVRGSAAGLLMRPAMKALLVAAAALTGYLSAHATPPEPVIITRSPETLPTRVGRTPRGGALIAPQLGQTTTGDTATTQVSCMLTAPDPSSTCVNGFWQTPASAATGAARFDRANGCVTVQPAGDMICRNGLWTLRGSDASAATASTTTDPTRPPPIQVPSAETPASPVAGGSVGAGTCSGSAPPVLPSQTLACVNGAWVVR